MSKIMTSTIIGLALALTAITGTAETKAKGKVASAIAGKLVKADGSKVKDYAVNAAPKYYVLYYSASW